MSREIKFRVWWKGNENHKGQWREGMLIEDNGTLADDDCAVVRVWQSEKDKYVVQQFTGLKDKNGKEIYEGDIVKYPQDTPSVNNGRFDISIVGYETEDDWLSAKFIIGGDYARQDNTEVIGNIFENPELSK